ncbi:hypothetical protein LAZ67_23000867 [Cordylochernes scorpioides]|uniref:Reverse transcriptase domain-containing protein n=1 Tax=Cordylochernes scorpioides TaxID=51811 RepID=A0ABY6LR96_9ARAC|nr:hypothetical protein LAZ67_23000867 [Cordylochernes scorpioides]
MNVKNINKDIKKSLLQLIVSYERLIVSREKHVSCGEEYNIHGLNNNNKGFRNDTTTKPHFTLQEKGRKSTRDKVSRLRGKFCQKHVISIHRNGGSTNLHQVLCEKRIQGCRIFLDVEDSLRRCRYEPKTSFRVVQAFQVAEEAGISFGSIQSIMKDILGVRRLNAVLVPKNLTFDQKNARKETASLNLEATTDDPELLKRVITGDETWIYGFDSETTQQASEWRFKNEPRPKKARKAPSKVKVMLTVFFDYQGIVHHEFQQQGSTITTDSHVGVLRRLREAIRQKRPEQWRSKSWILHHDNAPAHTAVKISKFLQDNSISVFPQRPYSPDLGPCNFFLSGKLKKKLKGRKFHSIEEIKVESKKAMKAIPKTDYKRCFADWKKRWLQCIAANGDYFEGDNLNLGARKEHIIQAPEETFLLAKEECPLLSFYNQKQQSSNVVNLSNRTLSPSEISLLEKGLKFRIPSKPNIPEVISSVESTIKQYSLQDKHSVRTMVAKTLTKPYTPPPNYRADLRTLQRLKQSKSIVITRSDKGSNTVIMNQEDYRTKMHDLLGDDTTFSPISDKVSLSLAKVFRTFLLQLKISKHITPDDYKLFISNLSNSAYIYGLPKIHKPDVPLRPIIAYHLSPAYPLAKFLSNYLSPLLNNHRNIYSIRSTPHFISELTALNPAPHFTMCSFDVTSLYISLPHSLITDSLERFLGSQSVDPHTASSIAQLTKLCLNMNSFTFLENHYRQIKGSPMGIPLSSIIAEVAMSEIDHWITRTLPIDIQIWRRYIDGVFCLCRNGQESTILAALNSYNPNISFTLEIESNQLDQAVSDLNFSNMRCLRLEASALNGYLERWSFRSTEGMEDEIPDLSCELEQVLGPSGDVCMEELSADDLMHVLGSSQDVCMPDELSHLSPLDIEQVLGIPEQGGLDNAPTVDDLTLSRILEAESHFSSLEEKLDSFEADVFSLEEKLDSFEADIIDILQQALQRHKTIRFFLQTEVELIKTNDASELVMEHEKTCRVHGAQRVKYPKEGSKLSFSKFSNNFKQIFAIYAYFEAILQPNPDPSKYSVHVPCSYCYIVVDPESNIVHKEIYCGENPAEKFLLSLFSTVSKLKERLRNYISFDMNEQQKIDFLNEQTCHICKKQLDIKTKVIDHCHWSGRYRGAAHKIYNLNYHNNSKFRCLLHGAKNYDNHFLIKALRHVPHKHLTIIPMNIEKYSVILVDDVIFLDSFQFLSASLNTLSSNLPQDGFKVLSQCFPYQTDLLRRKGVYPYEYMTDSSKFSETSLPPIEYFSSKLLNESCSSESYAFAQQVWEELNCTTLGDYHDIYLIDDVALLADIFQYFRDLCLRHYQLDPILNFSSPSLSLTQH